MISKRKIGYKTGLKVCSHFFTTYTEKLLMILCARITDF